MTTSVTDEGISVHTDAVGVIVSCSPGAARLLGYTVRGARGRALPNMFVSERPRLSELLAAAQGLVIRREAEFRPNDRKAVRVRFELAPAAEPPQTEGPILLRWTFSVRWPVTMCLPPGVDRRELITVWRSSQFRCIFVPAPGEKRRLMICSAEDEVVHQELVMNAATALMRAGELQTLASAGDLPARIPSAPAANSSDGDSRLP